MAIYHLTVKYISRKKAQRAVLSAAYRSGEKLHDEYWDDAYDYTRKTGIVHTEVLLPPNAPSKFENREILWNAVEQAEKRIDSRLAREVEIALPKELTLDEHIKLVREYVNDNFVSEGMCADVAIHVRYDNNPHAHILLTTRTVDKNGFSKKKNRGWDKRENVRLWREKWEFSQNRELQLRGHEMRVSHKSYKDRNIDREATKHLGHVVMGHERRGISTRRGDENRVIISRNKEREEERNRIRNRERGR